MWGNNAQLGHVLGLVADGLFGEQQLGWLGQVGSAPAASVAQFAQHVEQKLGRAVTLIDATGSRPLGRVAWCSGGAQSYFEAAIAAGAEVFLTGEISEQHVHFAREAGVSFIACGHHASERYGAPACMDALARRFGLNHEFIEINSPA